MHADRGAPVQRGRTADVNRIEPIEKSRPAARRLLLATVGLPVALAALLSVWRLGVERRAAVSAEHVAAAEAFVRRLQQGEEWNDAVVAARQVGATHEFAVYLAASLFADRAGDAAAEAPPAPSPDAAPAFVLMRSSSDAAPPTGAAPPAAVRGSMPGAVAPEWLPLRVVRLLLERDRAFATTLARRPVAVAPIKDADDWDIVGAVVATPQSAMPPLLPPLPLVLVLLTSLATALLVAWRAPVAGERRHFTAGDLLVLLAPALIFHAWLTGVVQVPGGSAGFRFWSMAFFMGAAAVAAIGVSLAGIAGEPLRARQSTRAWLFLLPSFFHLLLFSMGPILFALYLSFHEWNLIEAERPFVGLANYVELAGDAGFWRAVRNTAVYVLFVPAGMVLALALALLVDRGMPAAPFLRAVFFLPYITSFVAISLVWKWMFEPEFGLLNAGLRAVGLPAQPWLSSPATALPSLMLMSIWMYAGYMMVIFLAGLQSIPETLYESARMDGAGAWQRFRRITLPLLRPTIFFILVTMVIFMFQVFTAVYVMTEGGPLHATDVIVYHIYRNAWEYLRMGYASAMAWVLFAIVFAITLVQFRWLGGRLTQ